MPRLHQENANCHMSISLKVKNHINIIGKVQVITPHSARQKFGMLIFVHGMTSSLKPDHLTPLPFLLSHELVSAPPPTLLWPLPCLHTINTLKICLQHHPHPRCLPCLHSCIRAIGYGILLGYMINPITEIF
ncbi:hypothetical protein O181_024364 [Austropuccinia psidii MF-1]|uniref:Uncharacterized protein n=1 Tax=Austropuccinia psidii MF-1 TaxID=1389203 RepID=A0A9Q3CG56_9BASI|nr:hypothetical protein [Austropuccinia psidii MF-1]